MSRLSFTLEGEAPGSRARAGHFTTLHGRVQTPVFMPVGTQATVKSLRVADLETSGSQVVLANTYHLLLRPGPQVFEAMGGIHRFMNWDRPVLTDSGGFQIFSLPNARTMTEEGASFKSYVDGSRFLLSPEISIATQRAIGSDIMMVLDQCVPSTSDHDTATRAMHLTHRWARRSLAARGDSPQSLFAIVQGACFPDLRRESARVLTEMPFDGFAIGGLAVGETRAEREDFTELTAELLPRHMPRYLMGVGTPLDLLEAVHRGVDMFDCIMPTALARQGVAFTSQGKLCLRRSAYKFADAPLDPACACAACRNYPMAYLHHLIKASEILGWSLLALHNLHFYHGLMAAMRRHILAGTFAAFHKQQREELLRTDNDLPDGTRPQPPRKRPAKPKVLGAFQVKTSPAGFASILHTASGEVMHANTAPDEEARRLYVDQSRLGARLASRDPAAPPLVVWDVGLGAAHNAMAAIRCHEEAPEPKRPLRLVSFEHDLDALRLAVSVPGAFHHIRHAAPKALLQDGRWTSKTGDITWELVSGDFRATMPDAPVPDLIYFDPFSHKTDKGLWTLAAFQAVFAHCRGHATELFTYSSSTAVRGALLAAGFYVGKGAGTGAKSETTVALTPAAHVARASGAGSAKPFPLLDAAWLGTWRRSDAKYPRGIAADALAAFEEAILGHAQFAALALAEA